MRRDTRGSLAGGSTGRTRGPVALLLVPLVVAFFGFVLLGNWQWERRAWKLDLIERVDQRVHAPPVAAPGRDSWQAVNRGRDEYRHVFAEGRFLSGFDTRVAAATELGTGYWVMSPLARPDGTIIVINRGFIGQGVAVPEPPSGESRVEGLLRITEPGGGILRENRPADGRWYSRDIAALAAAWNLDNVAPYFVDAGASAVNGEVPAGGLTVIRFHNSHLVYAITWYALAGMSLAAGYILLRVERNRPD